MSFFVMSFDWTMHILTVFVIYVDLLSCCLGQQSMGLL